LEEMRTREGSRFFSAAMSSSEISTLGSMTVPEAITGVQLGYMIPEGIIDRASRCSPTMMVCPALFPPW
jgi:hypothetical protein